MSRQTDQKEPPNTNATRICPICGADISARHPLANRCRPCAPKRPRSRERPRRTATREDQP